MSTPSNFPTKRTRTRNATVSISRRNLTTSTAVNQVNRFTLRRAVPLTSPANTPGSATYAQLSVDSRDFTSANFADYSALAGLYQQYRVRWIKITFVPRLFYLGNAGGTGANAALHPLHVYTVGLNIAATRTFTSEDDILQVENVRYNKFTYNNLS